MRAPPATKIQQNASAQLAIDAKVVDIDKQLAAKQQKLARLEGQKDANAVNIRRYANAVNIRKYGDRALGHAIDISIVLTCDVCGCGPSHEL